MPSVRVKRLLGLASELSTEERAELTAELLAELDVEVDGEEWERSWRAEIERRLAVVRPGIPWEEARRRVQQRIAATARERMGR